ncbi:MAG: aminodeoxychorismate/anthranilate synthase component II [Acidobacteriota bacterium]|nr:aminodeoxychorismate/anthranilate synthase component II [Acidobacteriota bacterium]
MKILVIDNYDSFTYNLVQYLGELGAELEVFRNDAIRESELDPSRWDRVVISPGPGVPSRAGVTPALVHSLGGKVPILGVCLGHQAIGEAFGGRIVRAPVLMHGKTSSIRHDGRGLFRGLPTPFEATRYHSLIVARETVPACLEISAWTDDGIVMGLRHREQPIEGVQFHPESILTLEGKRLLGNFLEGEDS